MRAKKNHNLANMKAMNDLRESEEILLITNGLQRLGISIDSDNIYWKMIHENDP